MCIIQFSTSFVKMFVCITTDSLQEVILLGTKSEALINATFAVQSKDNPCILRRVSIGHLY